MVIKTMMLIDRLFSEIVDRYEDLDISKFEWRVIQGSHLGEKVKVELRHKSRPTLVFSELVERTESTDWNGYNMALAFDSLLHQCCAALDINLIEKGCE